MQARLGAKLSRLGRKWDLPWLAEHPLVFRFYHRLARENSPGVMRALERAFPQAVRYVDIGAGSGAFAAEAIRRGRRVSACEYSPFGRAFARVQGVRCRRLDLLRKPPAQLDGPFDLAYCLEGAQQLDDKLGTRLVEFVSKQAPVVVFSSGQPGQGGAEPVNLQPKSYWIERFDRFGLRHRPGRTAELARSFVAEGVTGEYFVENVLVFERPGS